MSQAVTGTVGGAASGAATGAIVGTVVPGVGTLVGAGVGGLVGGLGGLFSGMAGDDAAEAAGQIAQRQLEYAIQNRNLAMGVADQAIGISGWTLQELQDLSAKNAQLERTYWMQQAALSRDYQLLDSVDPALRQAGVQAYSLMKGQEAAALAPIRAQRNLQKTQLVDKLQRQLGSGWESSSAGIEAMSRFESETSSMMAQAQSATLAQFLGVAQAVRPDMLKQVNSAELTLQSLADSKIALEQSVQNRMLQAYNNKIAAITGTNVASYAGAEHVSSLISAQNTANQINSTMGGLGTLAGLAAGLASRPAAAAVTPGAPAGKMGINALGGGGWYDNQTTRLAPYGAVG